MRRQRRGLELAVVAGVLAACSVDTSDVHFVPDDVLSSAGKVTGAGNTGTGNTGADDAGGTPGNGGNSSTGGSGNKAGSTGKAGQATGGTLATAGSPATGGVTNAGGPPVGGAGGVGGMPIGCPNAVANRNEPLIDNFDDGDPGLPMPPLGVRAVGSWSTTGRWARRRRPRRMIRRGRPSLLRRGSMAGATLCSRRARASWIGARAWG